MSESPEFWENEWEKGDAFVVDDGKLEMSDGTMEKMIKQSYGPLVKGERGQHALWDGNVPFRVFVRATWNVKLLELILSFKERDDVLVPRKLEICVEQLEFEFVDRRWTENPRVIHRRILYATILQKRHVSECTLNSNPMLSRIPSLGSIFHDGLNRYLCELANRMDGKDTNVRTDSRRGCNEIAHYS